MLQLMVVFFGPYFLLGISLGTNYRFIAVIIVLLSAMPLTLQRYTGRYESMAVGRREDIGFWVIPGPTPSLE